MKKKRLNEADRPDNDKVLIVALEAEVERLRESLQFVRDVAYTPWHSGNKDFAIISEHVKATLENKTCKCNCCNLERVIAEEKKKKSHGKKKRRA